MKIWGLINDKFRDKTRKVIPFALSELIDLLFVQQIDIS